MARITSCIHNGTTISIRQALQLKERNRRHGLAPLKFVCIECGEHLRPHRGSRIDPHFEHVQRNPQCSMSHVI